ncbi:restriction endonuclease subunit S [Oceanospirillum beijerinckii]|uniref:restriction endonuclease subunit S n=1 Tax=Oceanospirillum beijerinckii TaxID=64976 RepID=UPI0004067288|nr:restriction endonuclease subunit S [Oceanospirillum beijerinckii]
MTDKQTVKFGDICREVKLTTKDPIADGYERYIGLEHLDSGSLKIKRWGLIAEDKPSFTRVFKKGQILFGKRRPYLKKAAIAEFDGICSGDIIVLEPRDSLVVPKILPFIIQSDGFWEHAVNTSSGSLSPRTKYKELAKLDLCLPGEKKLNVFSDLFIKCQELLDTNDSMVISHSRLRAAMTNDLLFTKNGGPGFWGNIPKGFSEVGLSDITFESAFGPRYPSDLYSSTGNIGTIRTTDFTNDGEINYETIPFANLKESTFSKHFLKPGDILITRSGTCGLVAVYDKDDCDIIPGAFIIRFRLKPGFNPYYIKLFLMLPRVQHYISQIASGGVQKNLTSKNLLKIKILYPDDDRVVDRLLESESVFLDLKRHLNDKVTVVNKINNSLVSKMV